jgi:hypothetical protein
MAFFDPRKRLSTEQNRKLYAAYEIAYTLVDFTAAILFVTGSILFFNKSLETIAVWCFLAGSLFFGLKPTIRVVREFQYLAVGDVEDLAKAAER